MKLLFISVAFFWAMIALTSASGYDGRSVPLAAALPNEVTSKATRNKHEPYGPIPRAVNLDDPMETPPIPAASPNSRDASALIGINCRGSGRCPTCNTNIDELLVFLNLIEDNTYYVNGQKIVCRACDFSSHCATHQCPGLCVFAQHLNQDQKVSGKVVKEKVHWIKQHGCNRCGSCPIYPGNDASTGEITVNFVTNGCMDGVCQ